MDRDIPDNKQPPPAPGTADTDTGAIEASGGSDGNIKLWDAVKGSPLRSIPASNPITSGAVHDTILATGHANVPPIANAKDDRLADFRAALSRVLADLAIQIVRDGEGATKLVTVNVEGAVSDASAKIIARTICESPLVKTAIAGEDANWGRIVMAIGRADQPVRREMIGVRFGELWAARNGMISTAYDEAAMSAYMKQTELEISVIVGPGSGRARMYTCDLTKRYIEINGDYRS